MEAQPRTCYNEGARDGVLRLLEGRRSEEGRSTVKRDEVLRIVAGHRDELRRQFGVTSLALFGSVARDEGKETSDVDLLVEFDRPVGYFHLFRVEDYLEKCLGGAKVDLVVRRAVIEELKDRILAEAIDVVP